jgi:hypothetical protein
VGAGVPVLVGIDDRRRQYLRVLDDEFVGLVKSFAREREKERGDGVPGLL